MVYTNAPAELNVKHHRHNWRVQVHFPLMSSPSIDTRHGNKTERERDAKIQRAHPPKIILLKNANTFVSHKTNVKKY